MRLTKNHRSPLRMPDLRITQEEILADLMYPARPTTAPSKRGRGR